jgi:hypothetical protein
MDLVYVIGPTQGDSNELKYSLRSVEKYGKNHGKIIIVGHLPNWIDKSNVIHIPEDFNFYKERNIMECVRLVCKDDRVSNDFIFMNDDFFLKSKTNFKKLPTYIRPYDLHHYVWSENRTHLRWAKYTRIIEKTHNVLVSKGLPILTYDIHLPMPINKSKYLEAMYHFDWNCPFKMGFTARSIYGNFHSIPGTVTDDVKINKMVTFEGTLRVLENKQFFSTGEIRDTQNMLKVFEHLYPNKSKYEI